MLREKEREREREREQLRSKTIICGLTDFLHRFPWNSRSRYTVKQKAQHNASISLWCRRCRDHARSRDWSEMFIITRSHFVVHQWHLVIIISRESKWGTLKSAGKPAMHSSCRNSLDCTDRRDLDPAAQWRNWDGLNVDTSNPAGGLGGGGGAVSPPAGFGAVPWKFFKFIVSITSGHLFLASLDRSFWHSVETFK